MRHEPTYLVTKHSHAGGRGHLIQTKPNGRQPGRKRKDAHLGQSHDRLANEAHVEERRVHRKDLNPGAHTSAHHSDQGGYAESLLMTQRIEQWKEKIYFPETKTESGL